jgi:hypothetical protein
MDLYLLRPCVFLRGMLAISSIIDMLSRRCADRRQTKCGVQCPPWRTNPRLSRPEDFGFKFIEVGLGRQETFSKIIVRTRRAPSPQAVLAPTRLAPPRPEASRAELDRADARQGEPQYAAIRQAAIRRASIRQAKKSSGANLTLGTPIRVGQTARIDPERKVVATDSMSRIDVKRSSAKPEDGLSQLEEMATRRVERARNRMLA